MTQCEKLLFLLFPLQLQLPRARSAFKSPRAPTSGVCTPQSAGARHKRPSCLYTSSPPSYAAAKELHYLLIKVILPFSIFLEAAGGELLRCSTTLPDTAACCCCCCCCCCCSPASPQLEATAANTSPRQQRLLAAALKGPLAMASSTKAEASAPSHG